MKTPPALRKHWPLLLILGLLAFESVFSVAIVHKVPYTEIDWIAYMQEVEGPLVRNDWDYENLRGDTGPLVYPAGFVYLFMGLFKITDHGTDIRLAQFLYVALYIAMLAVLFAIYRKAAPDAPWWVFVALCASRRVHSLFMLRLFNDCFAMFFLYCAILLVLHQRWWAGAFVYSLSVSIKMNTLLYAPGLGALMLLQCGVLKTAGLLLLCVGLQLALAVPFLQANAWGYVHKAFEFSRVFFYKWTVNLKFLPEPVFLSKRTALLLLAGHLSALAVFGLAKWVRPRAFFRELFHARPVKQALNARYMVLVLFSSNLAGMAFSRSMHYQFLVWYYHTLPFLAHAALPWPLALGVLAGVEVAFNVFPATAWSSALLCAAHGVLLLALLAAPWPAAFWRTKGKNKNKKAN